MERQVAAVSLWRPGFTRFDTSEAPPRERFDYWCALFPLLDMQPMEPRETYRSIALSCAGDDGTVFAYMRAGPTASHFAEGRDERVMLSLFLGGGALVRHGRGREDAAVAGTGFNLLDCTGNSRTLAGAGHESLHLSFPRSRVVEVMGDQPAGDGASFRHLPDTPLGHILKASLAAVARHGAALDAHSAARTMEALGTLGLAFLAQFRPKGVNGDETTVDRHVFEAACSYIDAHLHDASLGVERVARAARCSRTQLYRLFARRGLSVASHIRELRLLRSRSMLRDPLIALADVALRSGYSDLPAYGKAFKRRFGMPPSEWRLEAMEA